MNILAVDGVPAKAGKSESPVSTAAKIRMLQAADEDLEWYPTTDEIMEAMKKDLWGYLNIHKSDYSAHWRGGEGVKFKTDYDGENESLYIDTFLDIGAGDGRVLDFFNANKKYGIEIARAQADDLIRRGVFIIGRNYWDCSLVDHNYALIFSNPPYSQFEKWVTKILFECNFEILYLVMPIRWKNQKEIVKALERYEVSVIDEFDFSHADRAARGRVNLVRINAPWERFDKNEKNMAQKTLEDSFSRWVRDCIADFKEEPDISEEESRERSLAFMKTPIDQLIDEYDRERISLGEAFSAIGKLDSDIIKLMGQDKASMLEIIKKSIRGLKSKYWRAAFDKMDAVRKRMTKETKRKIFNSIEEFKHIDFNADNIYSIAIWLINNVNIGILDQIGEVFDGLTDKENIETYKSNKHWIKSDWKHTKRDYEYEKLPDRWKLDYRIVVRPSGFDKIVDDFIVVCGNLGFPIRQEYKPDYCLHSELQGFYTIDNELAFTMRYYTGNNNAHLKINKKILMKFNIEVAKIRKWISTPDDIIDEFDVTKADAVKLWNSGIVLVGKTDMQMLECKEAV